MYRVPARLEHREQGRRDEPDVEAEAGGSSPLYVVKPARDTQTLCLENIKRERDRGRAGPRQTGRQERVAGQTRAIICRAQELGVWYFPAGSICH